MSKTLEIYKKLEIILLSFCIYSFEIRRICGMFRQFIKSVRIKKGEDLKSAESFAKTYLQGIAALCCYLSVSISKIYEK